MQHIDFLPEHIKAHRLRRRRLVQYCYVLVVIAAGIGLWGYSWRGRISRANDELKRLEHQCNQVHIQLAGLEQLQRQQAQLLIKERISNTLGSRVNALDLLAELERVLPQGVSLMNLTMEAVQVQVPIETAANTSSRTRTETQHYSTVNRVKFTVTAIAPTDVDVANSIAQLSSSPLLEDINMAYARTINMEGRQAKEFQAVCHVAR